MLKCKKSNNILIEMELDLENALKRIENLEKEIKKIGEKNMSIVNLQSPWVILYRKVQAMFAEDKDIRVVLDGYDVKIYTNTKKKARALRILLDDTYKFGNITSNVVIPEPNTAEETPVITSIKEVFESAFEGNSALSYIVSTEGTMLPSALYVVFKNKVVQYHNDDLTDVNGCCSTLYQEIAKEILVTKDNGMNIYYNTDVPENLGKPLGEWP